MVSASPETHVSLTRDGRRGAEAHRRLPAAGRRRRQGRRPGRGAPARREGAGRAPDAGRPRPQRPRPRLRRPAPSRSRALEIERYSHIMHLVSEVEGRLRADQDAFSLLAADVPRRHRLGGAEGARDAAHLRDRGRPAAASTRARSATSATTARWTRASPCGPSSCATGSPCCRPAQASWPTRCPDREHEECLQQDRRARRRDRRGRDGAVRAMTRHRAGDPRRGRRPRAARACCSSTTTTSFTYNLAHLLCEPGAEVEVYRNDAVDGDGGRGLAPDAPRHLPRPGPAGRGRRLERR